MLVPYLVGFHPHHELIVLAFDSLGFPFTACTSLDNGANDTREAVEVITKALARAELLTCQLIGYYEPESNAHVSAIMATWQAIEAAGIEVGNVITVRDGHWSQVYCCSEPFCPHGPQLIPDDPELETALVAQGRSVLPDRAAVEALMALAPDTDRVEVARGVADMTDHTASSNHALREVLAKAEVLLHEVAPRSPLVERRDMAAVIVASWHREFTRTAIAAIDAAPTDLQCAYMAWWRWVARHAQGRNAAPAAYLCAYAARRTGNGLIASRAIDLAITAAPNWAPAQHLADAIASGWAKTSAPHSSTPQLSVPLHRLSATGCRRHRPARH